MNIGKYNPHATYFNSCFVNSYYSYFHMEMTTSFFNIFYHLLSVSFMCFQKNSHVTNLHMLRGSLEYLSHS